MRRPRPVSFAYLIFLAAVPPLAWAVEEAKPDADGWIVLFDGKDLSGWHKARPVHTDDPLWTVEDGAMTNLPPDARDIATKAEFGDFDLILEYRTVKEGNSGVYLRGRIEVQVFDSCGKKTPDTSDDGAIFGQVAPAVNASKPAGEWNTLELRLVGAVITVKLNGQTIHDKVKLEKVCNGALPGGLLDPGPIRLQGDHGKVWYRNLKLRPVISGEKAGKN